MKILNKEVKLDFTRRKLCLAVAVGSVFLFVFFCMVSSDYYRSGIVEKEYVGVLESITYEHGGAFHSISNTFLHFEDGTTFDVEGHHVYELGETYRVVYEKNMIGGAIEILEVKKVATS